MKEKNVSIHQLAKETGISRQTISNIKNNPFHNTSGHLLGRLALYFNVNLDEIVTPVSDYVYLEYLLNLKKFSDVNIQYLESLIFEKTNILCQFHVYASEESLNINSKNIYKKFAFSGNFRSEISFNGLTFNIIDFDFHKKDSSYLFKDFFLLYQLLIKEIEHYALNIGFTQIIVNIEPWHKDLFVEWKSNGNKTFDDLESFITKRDYTNKENSLIKNFIIEKLGYHVLSPNYSGRHSIKYIKLLNPEFSTKMIND